MSKKRKGRLLIWTIAAVLLAIFAFSPLYPYVRSLGVMSIYSRICEKDSIMEKENIRLFIPYGEGWYPFTMCYCADDSFAGYIGKDEAKLSILYNFPAFTKKGCSALYDETSPYYSSFYGAYLVQLPEREPYGFGKDGGLEPDTVAKVAAFDFFWLVLGDFGIKPEDKIFSYELQSLESAKSFLGYEGWTRVQAAMKVNGVNHKKDGFVQSYLQYGSPRYPCQRPFAPVEMNCTLIGRYFEEWNTSVFFYVMSPSAEVCRECEDEILSRGLLE